MADSIRVLLVSDAGSMAALREIAANAGVTTEPHEIPPGPHNLDLVALAALVVIAKSVIDLAEAIIGVWKKTGHPTKITISTPKGSVTVESDNRKTVEELLAELRPLIA